MAQVRDAVLNVARYDIEGLREALLAGDLGRLSRTLDGLMQEGEAPPLVLWAMTEEVRALAQAKGRPDAGPAGHGAAQGSPRLGARRQSLFKRALPRVTDTARQRGIRKLARIDRMIKGIGGGDVWTEFLQLALRLARRG